MSDSLNLTMPERKPGVAKTPKFVVVLLVCVLLVGGANLYLSLMSVKGNATASFGGALSPEAIKELALRLEKRGLKTRASEVWKEYLAQGDITSTEQAKIWYRIAKLYQEAESYEAALDAYFRSETVEKVPSLETDINRGVQEALESLGKFAALRYELSDRVGMTGGDSSAGDTILAEIGSMKITQSMIDQRIEEMIERQTASMAAYMSDEQMKSQKESLLKRFSSTQERLRLLQQIVSGEMLYRKAREDKIADDPLVRRTIRDIEHNILAQKVMEKELRSRINITENDVKTYFEANMAEFREPDKAEISHILVKERETADAIMMDIQKGDSFEKLAAMHSLDKGSPDGKIKTPVQRGGYIPGIGGSEEISKIIFATAEGQVAAQPVQSDKGFHIIKVRKKISGKEKTFEEARQEAFRTLQGKKEREVSENLMKELKEKYDVVMHTAEFKEEK